MLLLSGLSQLENLTIWRGLGPFYTLPRAYESEYNEMGAKHVHPTSHSPIIHIIQKGWILWDFCFGRKLWTIVHVEPLKRFIYVLSFNKHGLEEFNRTERSSSYVFTKALVIDLSRGKIHFLFHRSTLSLGSPRASFSEETLVFHEFRFVYSISGPVADWFWSLPTMAIHSTNPKFNTEIPRASPRGEAIQFSDYSS